MESATESEAAWPPAGWVRKEDVARMFGIAPGTLKHWYRTGRIRFGKDVAKPGRGRCKIYPVAELQALMEQMRAEHLKLPEGFVSRDEAARMFNVSTSGWKKWQQAGRVPAGQWARVPGLRPRVRIYAREELQRLREEFEQLGEPYPDPDRPGCWRVPVMSFRTTLCEAIVDAEDLPRVAGRRWNWLERGDGYDPAVVLADPVLAHTPMRQIILGLDTAHWRVVHANGDPLDCRRANLIVRSLSEQAAASRKPATHRGKPCTSRFKGVSWEETRGKWRVAIQKGGVTRRLGRFDDELAAAEAYDEAARELFGEHARLNFPDGIDAFLAAAQDGDGGARAAA